MKKFYDKLLSILVYMWGMMWVAIITFFTVDLLIVVVKWFVSLMEAL